MNTVQKMIKGNLRPMALVAFVASMLLAGCGKKDARPVQSEGWLARVDNSYLTAAEVVAALPAGMTADDSLRFVKAFVNNWIDSKLISDVAIDEVDMGQVDQLVEEYRRNLIVSLYRRAMFESHAAEISEDSVVAFYETHRDQWKLQKPMVRGTYVKLPDGASNLRTLRRLYSSEKAADIDRLEKEVLSSAIHYDYFRDRWVDWVQIESKIPYDFGDASKWLSSHRTLDFSSGGFTYLLYISEILPAGSTVPLEGVRSDIIDMMLRSDRQNYDARLDRQLRESALESGRLEIRGFE